MKHNYVVLISILTTLLIAAGAMAQPTISSVSPLIGYPASTATVTGTGFNATTANNVVYFGATRATVTAATATSLTVTVPVGATFSPVSVDNVASHLTAFSQNSFLPNYNNSAFAPGTANFDTKVDFAAGSNPYAIAIGDIDGDGKPDLVVVNVFSSSFSVYRNTSTSGSITAGSFAAKVDFTTVPGPESVVIGDIDGDGKLDIVVGNFSANTISVFRNTSTSGSITSGSLAAKVDFATGTNPRNLAIGDIDGDGKPDIASANYGSNNVSVLRNTSTSGTITTGSFAAKVDFATGTQCYAAAIGDIDGDGKPDLAVVNGLANTLSVFRNISTSGSITAASFAAKVDFATGASPCCVAICDIDGDGKPDLAVDNYNPGSISIYRNTSTSGSITSGSLASPVTFATGINCFWFAIGDIDGDGKPDIASANSSVATVSVLLNTSTSGAITAGSFAAKVDFTVGSAPYGVAIGDLDGDGKPELAAANNGANTISVIRNNPLQPITGSPTINICSGTTNTTLTEATTGGTWSSSNIAVGTVGTTGIVTAISPGTTVITYAGAAGLVTGNVATIVVTVNGAPAITTMSPSVGYPTSSVTITGSNFNATAANDIVYFGATKANVATASSTSLSVTVPVGATYMPVSIDNMGCNLAAYSQYPFLPTYNNTAFVAGTGNFDVKVDFTTGATPEGTAIGDIDGDGKPDLVVVNYGSNTVSVFRNTSASGSIAVGSFAAKVDFTTGTGPQSVAIGDIDGDGKPDLAIANSGSNTVSVLRNTSTAGSITAGSLAAKVDFTTGTSPSGVTIGDIDGDGKPDLAVADYGSAKISIFRNTGASGNITSGSFAAKVDFTTGTNPQSMAIGDLDGDGKPDLAVADKLSNAVSVFRNTSTSGSITAGSFAAKVDFTTGTQPYCVSIGDVDGDGKPDLAVTNSGSNTVSIFPNTSTAGSITTGSFSPKVDFTTGSFPISTAIGDIDGDGKPDLTIANYSSNTVSVFRNTSTSGSITSGSLAAKIDFTTGTGPISISVGDVDGDGKPDLFVADQTTATISILRNDPLQAITGSITVCAGATTTLSDAAAGGTWSSSNTAVSTVGSSTGAITGIAGGTAMITYAGTAGASFSANIVTAIVTVTGAPAITSVSPLISSPASAVTITGSGFSTITTNNIVYFGATRAAVTGATATSLNVTVPTGATYKPVSADNNGCALTAYSPYSFLPTYNNSIYQPGTMNFIPRVDFTTGTSPQINAIGDLDGDGKPDMVVANYLSNTISVFHNVSSSGAITSGSFETKVDFATNAGPVGLALGDIDGDGRLDIVVSHYSSSFVSVFRNISTSGSITAGSFAAKVDFATGGSAESVAIGDLDGDGRPDIAVASYGSAVVSVYKNTGSVGAITTGSFAARVDLTTGSGSEGVAIGDIDGDGKPEIVVTNYSTNNVSVLRNQSTTGTLTTGSFAAKVDFATGTYPFALAIGDIDGDGKPDISVTNYNSSNVSVLRNTSTSGSITSGSLASAVNFTTGAQPRSVSIGDIDGDGKPELAIVNQGSVSISLLRNTSTSGTITGSSFAAKMDLTTGSTPVSVSVGDIDGDNKPDLVVSNNGVPSLSVIRNSPLVAIPTITSINPLAANPGSTATITGTNFNSTPVNNIVFFGATRANVTAATTTSLTVTVPTGDTYMPVSVTNTASSLTASSLQPFLPTYDNSLFVTGKVNFDLKADIATSVNPETVAIGDLDGDGKPDMVVANTTSGGISIYKNISTSGSLTAGSFAPKFDFATGTYPNVVVIQDVDGDGKPDIVISNYSFLSNTISIFRNISTSGTLTAGSFAAKVDITGTNGPMGIAFGDLDGDGKPDMVVVNENLFTISVFRNTSTSGIINTSSFATNVDFSTGYDPRCPTIADIDGDGKPDILVANNYDNTVSVFRNTATSGSITGASLAAKVDFATSGQPFAIVATDIDGDGKLDIAVNSQNTAAISVLRNTATSGVINSSSFAPKIDFPTGSGAFYIAGGDIDGDGKPDLVSANFGAASVSVLRNTATSGTINSSSFAPKVDFATGNSPFGIAVGDLDGDGKPDLAVSNNGDNTMSLIRNNPLQAITGAAGLCVSANITLSNATTGGTWSSGNPSVATIGSLSGIVTGVAGGTAVMTYAGTAGASFTGNIVTTIVTVNAPATSGGANVAICNGSSTNLTASGATTYNWAPSTGLSGTTGTTVTANPTSTITYTVVGTTGDCSSSATVTVTVNAIPTVGTTGGGIAICNGTTATLSGTGATSYSWTGTITDGAAFTPPIGVNSYTVTGTTNGCSNTATTTVTVNPIPTVGTTGGGIAICNGTMATLSGTGATSYSWTGSITDGAAFTPPIGINSYTVTGITNGCSNTATTTVTVNAIPTVGTTGGNIAICNGTMATLSGTGATSYSWTGGITDGAAFTPSIGVNSYTVTGTTNGCTNTATTTVTVNAIPTVGTTGGNIAICNGTTATLSGTGATSYSWTGGITDGAAFTPSIGVNSYTVTGTTNGCSNTATTTVTVNAIPTVGTTGGNIAICNGTTATLSGTGATSYSWTGSITDGAAFTPSIGVNAYTVTGTTNGCSNTATTTITVNAIPTVGTTGGGIAICNGTMATLSGTGATSYSWTGGITDGAAFTPSIGVNSYTVTGTTNGCSNTATTTVTVNAIPTVGSTGGNIAMCSGNTATLSGTGAISYSWSGGVTNGTAFTPPLGINSYTVTGSTNGCSNVAVTTVTVNAIPTVSTTGGGIAICSGTTVTLNGTGATSYSWTGGIINGVAFTPAPGIHTYTVTGTTTGCSNTASTTITVTAVSAGSIIGATSVLVAGNITLTDVTGSGIWSASNGNATVAAGIVHGVSAGTVTISYSVTSAGCTGTATKLVTVGTSTTTGTVSAITGYYFYLCKGATTPFFDATPGGNWSINPADAAIASVSVTGVVSGLGAGTATLSYTVGASSATTILTVYPVPAAITGSAAVCQGTTTPLSDITPGGVWSSGIPATASIGSGGIVTGTNPGMAPIYYTLVAPAGCRATITVTVNANPSAITGPLTVCSGASITLSDITPGGTWSTASSNITIDGSGNVTGGAAGSAAVTYALGSGCSRTYNISVNSFTAGAITGASSVTVGLNSSLTDAVPGGTWSASNSNATVSATGIVTGVAAGTVNISYTVTNSCGSVTATYTITVNASISSGITGTLSVCTGSTTALTDAATGGTWHSANTSIATVGTSGIVTGIVAGTATISYTVAGLPTTVVVTVNPTPSSIGGATSVCNGSSVTLSDFTGGGTWTSTGGISVTTGTTVTTVTGLTDGANTVTYSLATGCFKTYAVTVKPIPTPILGNLAVCGVGAVTFLSDATTGTSWAINPVGTATISPSGRVYGVSTGNATVTYTATNTCKTTAEVTVNALLVVSPILGPTNVGHGLSISLSDATTGGIWSSSNPALGSVSVTGDVTGVGTSGSVIISYIVPYPSGSGCAAIATKSIAVHTPAPHAHATGVVGSSVSVVDETVAGTWASSDNGIATVDDNGVVNCLATGNVDITHTATNSDGAVTTTITQVVVTPLPFAVRLLPNPNNGTFTISGTTHSGKDEMVTIEITDILGQVVYTARSITRDGVLNGQITLSNTIANGMYLLMVRIGAEQKTLRFAVGK